MKNSTNENISDITTKEEIIKPEVEEMIKPEEKEVIKPEEEEEENIKKGRRKDENGIIKRSMKNSLNSTRSSTEDIFEDLDDFKADKKSKKTSCPVCEQLVPANYINAHLDRCIINESSEDQPRNNKRKQICDNKDRKVKLLKKV